ncbi:MlaE family lipid ABC transporter permease subunit [Polymorphobacter fuscus]|uniref:MlaE family lipid ABC transporter permease subunit n=2 Tax=Sandarakinorhabdus fusca TaxID=1439888 RepID=A0A7C9KWF3_9SPHN|nr:MlaE family lipid ABC transporter permease subunit [Polymorphobacter fuscus]MQT16602.1 MlaE family lipid ABC transporter permease subunit [Polymorphobacter fuscus]
MIEDSAVGDPRSPGESRRIAVTGDLTMASIGSVVGPLRAIEPAGTELALDLGGIERIDTAGAWIIHRMVKDWSAAGVPTHVENASTEAERLIATVAANDARVSRREPRGNVVIDRLSRIGAAMVAAANNIGLFLAFLGQTLVVLAGTVAGKRSLRWNAFIHQCEAIGVSALGIVGLLLFLVGMVVAQQGAVQLRQFGAEVFVVNLVGRSIARELGVLLTAIMVAGRSASAFAAQIGSMKLNQEVDALETIGLSPIEVLVIPRVAAMALMMLLLGFYGIVMAILGGGLFAWVSLDIPPSAFFGRIQEVTPLSDLVIGLIKAPVFGVIIAMMGCFQGLQVSGNAESVGERTTRAVVESIFAVIVIDAFFAVFFSALGFN